MKETKERLHRGYFASYGRRRHDARERAEPTAKQEHVDTAHGQFAALLEEELPELLEVAPVGGHGVPRRAPLARQMIHELRESFLEGHVRHPRSR